MEREWTAREITELKARTGLTLAGFGALFGVTSKAVSHWTGNKRRPPRATRHAMTVLARYLNVKEQHG